MRIQMILNGNQRGGGRQMALHLLNGHTNEHVEVHEVSGFISGDVHGALNEAYALSKGTKCRQFMYSLSLNPPQDKDVSIKTFEDTLRRAEKKLGLEGQPRVIVFHEKEGRRHAHCVWSRIDTQNMRAVNISHPKRKLTSLSKELYLENGWQLPKGFIDSKLKNPLNFTREEWSKAQRTGQNPRSIKEALQDSWQISDSRKAFEHALQERGYFLAKGDRRAIPIAVDLYGEVYSLPRNIGLKKAELEKRLGKTEGLRSADETKTVIFGRLTKQFQSYHQELQARQTRELEPLNAAKQVMTEKHRVARQERQAAHEKRCHSEELQRSARMRKGFKGLWDRLTGSYQRTVKKNEHETTQGHLRDTREKDHLIKTQLSERQKLQEQLDQTRQKHRDERAGLVKGMDKHYRKIDHQAEIRQLHNQEKHRLGPTIKRGPTHEPEL